MNMGAPYDHAVDGDAHSTGLRTGVDTDAYVVPGASMAQEAGLGVGTAQTHHHRCDALHAGLAFLSPHPRERGVGHAQGGAVEPFDADPSGFQTFFPVFVLRCLGAS